MLIPFVFYKIIKFDGITDAVIRLILPFPLKQQKTSRIVTFMPF